MTTNTQPILTEQAANKYFTHLNELMCQEPVP